MLLTILKHIINSFLIAFFLDVTLLHHFTTFSKKNNEQDNFRVIISLPKYITKGSDPIRQSYYTTKTT